MTIIAKNAKEYGLDDLDLDPPLEYETIELVVAHAYVADRGCD